MPATRYQGSKRKVLPFLYDVFKKLHFTTCLDAFGGTGSVTHLLRNMDKKVFYNEIMPSSCMIARALFANKPVTLTLEQLDQLLIRRKEIKYNNIIEKNYKGIYFLDEENKQLDTFCENIKLLPNDTSQAESYYLLFQSMLCKRPYNLFHRANLNMRIKDVPRSFGNKVTWEKPFIQHMHKFYRELCVYRKYQSRYKVNISCDSAFEIKKAYDVVYIDTPYAKNKGKQESNYFNFYHFLDAILDYDNIPVRAVSGLKHKPIYEQNKSWHPDSTLLEAFKALFSNYTDSSLVFSYRNDGYPAPEELMMVLREFYESVESVPLVDYKYALSTRKKNTIEIVLVAQNQK